MQRAEGDAENLNTNFQADSPHCEIKFLLPVPAVDLPTSVALTQSNSLARTPSYKTAHGVENVCKYLPRKLWVKGQQGWGSRLPRSNHVHASLDELLLMHGTSLLNITVQKATSKCVGEEEYTCPMPTCDSKRKLLLS
eukprot:3737701-Amphidinium_carterae.1